MSDPDYSPAYQDEYQRLWHEAAARAEAAEAERDLLAEVAAAGNEREKQLEARVTELEAANDIAAQEIASAMTSLSTGPAKDGYAYSCLANAAAALAKEDTDE